MPEYLHQVSSKQTLTFMARTCVQNNTGDECVKGKDQDDGATLLVCRVHCSEDGCNEAIATKVLKKNTILLFITSLLHHYFTSRCF
jgi:hypothetical protein